MSDPLSDVPMNILHNILVELLAPAIKNVVEKFNGDGADVMAMIAGILAGVVSQLDDTPNGRDAIIDLIAQEAKIRLILR